MLRITLIIALTLAASACGGGGGGGGSRSNLLNIRISTSVDEVSVSRSGSVTFSVTAEVINPPAGSRGLTISVECPDNTHCTVSPRRFTVRGTSQVTVFPSQQTRLGDLTLSVRATETHPSPLGAWYGMVVVWRDATVTVHVDDALSTLSFNTSGYRVRSQPRNLASGDLDGDGTDDIASTDATELNLLHEANGNFRVTDVELTSRRSADIVIADFDGDGLNDLAAIGGATLRTHRNLGLELRGSIEVPAFAEEQRLEVDASMDQLRFFDVNGDARRDLVAISSTAPSVYSFVGAGNGQFAEGDVESADEPARRFDEIDVDGDLDVDIVMASTNGGLSLLHNDSLGNFTVADAIATGSLSDDVVSADLNGDAVPDLVSVQRNDNVISVFVGNGNGGFFPPDILPSEGRPERVVVADFDNDGIPDLAVLNSDLHRVSIHVGLGNAIFDAPVHFSASLNCAAGESCDAPPHTLVAGDFNNDGWMDLATAVPSTACLSRCAAFSATIMVLRNRGM